MNEVPPLLGRNVLESFVKGFQERKESFLTVREQHGSPLYLLDEEALRRRAKEFTNEFGSALTNGRCPMGRIHYAVKSNHHPQVCRILCEEGTGLDVSSGEELQLALDVGADSIVFSGPGKTEAELSLALKHADRVTLLVDSFGELERLAALTRERDDLATMPLKMGVRLTVNEEGLWRKFGISLIQVARFMGRAEEIPGLLFQGLQFHTSWNLNPKAQVEFIEKLGSMLAGWGSTELERIRFIDIGGGFWPPWGEWLRDKKDPLTHRSWTSEPLSVFAKEIREAVDTHLAPHVQCEIWLEPGRWLCNDAMHLLLTVVDKKGEDLVITDGGTQSVGWERFESDYFPMINLSRPSLTEHPCHVLGSLCTPHDVWGYAYFGEDILPGDLLLIPIQGAYTYSLRQQFIKASPPVVVANGTDRETGYRAITHKPQ